ncbi:hypothetical protein RUMHYD_01186 [Blautia hydrogenotrophica DSM 10507]|uniref:Uncharacterized protein n=1 Tax=Blautia hydrogenotrophica (strain DSM 10507 / JCM 14656 / S5a33) TaxID=476272 RepID=C0CK16_BLAHS|nr:hypothetical protein RUMHYD_01186 [Blautia hydrogenotrophica DSM 10507]
MLYLICIRCRAKLSVLGRFFQCAEVEEWQRQVKKQGLRIN